MWHFSSDITFNHNFNFPIFSNKKRQQIWPKLKHPRQQKVAQLSQKSPKDDVFGSKMISNHNFNFPIVFKTKRPITLAKIKTPKTAEKVAQTVKKSPNLVTPRWKVAKFCKKWPKCRWRFQLLSSSNLAQSQAPESLKSSQISAKSCPIWSHCIRPFEQTI